MQRKRGISAEYTVTYNKAGKEVPSLCNQQLQLIGIQAKSFTAHHMACSSRSLEEI